MWSGQDKVWLHFVKNIMATDVYAAMFLSFYLQQLIIYKKHAASLEIIDLQKYKIITNEGRVKQFIKDRDNTPFKFIVGKN